jgi:hypothetical protein
MKDKIKTFDDVMNHLRIKESDFISPLDDKYDIASKKLKYIVRCFNGNWSPNWNDSSEYKYYPWFDMRSTGVSHGSGRTTTNPSSGFVFVGTIDDDTHTDVGSHLCFKNREDCEYVAKQFLDIYYDFFVWNVRIDNINEILK